MRANRRIAVTQVGADDENRADRSEWRDQTIWHTLAAAARSCPSRELLVVDDARYSYREILDLSQGLASALVREGVGRGDIIAFWLLNSLEWVVSFFAAARIGAVSVGLNTRLREDEIAYLLAQSQAKALVVSHRPGGVDFVELTYRLLPELRAGESAVCSDRFPSLRTIICTDPSPRPGMLVWPELAKPLPQASVPARPASPDDLALIQYTSGSTARPKGALLTHAALTRDARYFGDRMSITAEDRFFSGNPCFHVAAVVASLLNVVTHRATYVTMAHYEAGAALALLEREQCTARNGMDTMFQREMSHPDFVHRQLVLRKGTMMGAGTVFRLAHDRLGMTGVISQYSLSEASCNATSTKATDPLDLRATTVGRPLPGVELRLADPTTGAALPAGAVGEILLRGWNVMRGYHRDAQATAQAIDAEGWLHTGDLGSLDPGGNLAFVGRLKDVVRVGGENVAAAEVENFLLTHPAVKVVQVVAAPDGDLGEVPVAFVELQPDAECMADDLLAYCQGRLARFKVPRAIGFVTEWPVTGSGKIRKPDLMAQAAALRAQANG